jgi:hypothetical protein
MSVSFIVCVSRPPYAMPELRGCYLRWSSGRFEPLPEQKQATRYTLPHAARDVASRLEQAFPGARCNVEAVIQ